MFYSELGCKVFWGLPPEGRPDGKGDVAGKTFLQRHRPLNGHGEDPKEAVQGRGGGKRGTGSFVVGVQYGLEFPGIFRINRGRIGGAEKALFRQLGGRQGTITPFGLTVNHSGGTVISYSKNKIFS
jgi:hypothetical protein